MTQDEFDAALMEMGRLERGIKAAKEQQEALASALMVACLERQELEGELSDIVTRLAKDPSVDAYAEAIGAEFSAMLPGATL